MKIIINTSEMGHLPYISIEGIPKSKKSELMATKLVRIALKKKMFSKYTLNNWKNGTLVIRFATNKNELAVMLDAIEKDINLSENNSERSLLY